MHESQIMRLFGKERVADISEAERQFQEGIANFGIVEVCLHVLYITNLERCIYNTHFLLSKSVVSTGKYQFSGENPFIGPSDIFLCLSNGRGA